MPDAASKRICNVSAVCRPATHVVGVGHGLEDARGLLRAEERLDRLALVDERQDDFERRLVGIGERGRKDASEQRLEELVPARVSPVHARRAAHRLASS